jgi:hypothetical protein
MLTRPDSLPPVGPLLPVYVVVLLAVWLLPVFLGVRAARAKGRSPYWMWLGIHPLTGWIAFLWLRFFASPISPPPSQVLQPHQTQTPPPSDTPKATPSERIVVGTCEACTRPIRVKASALSPEMRLTCKCGHVNVVRKFGKCITCKRLIPLEEAHIHVSYYDLETYEDSCCPRCFREGDTRRGRLVDNKGQHIGRNYR